MSECIADGYEDNLNDKFSEIKDHYIFCPKCATSVCEYCSVHGPPLIIPDTQIQVKSSSIPRAVLTIPHTFLHIAPSFIPGAGLGIFSSITIPCDVRFGPYSGKQKYEVNSAYCWQVISKNSSFTIDAGDPNNSNWMRYVNCARNCNEQNLVAYQYRGQIYYRTIKIIPRYTELLVFYGGEYANKFGIDLRCYNKHHLSRGLDHTENDENKKPDFTVSENNSTAVHTKSMKENTILRPNGNNRDIGYTVFDRKSPEGTSKNRYFSPDTTKRFICETCQKSFSKNYYLKRHEIMHLTVKRLNCNYCDFKTNNRRSLINHINGQHIKNNTYTCGICNKILYTKTSLQKHEKIHFKNN